MERCGFILRSFLLGGFACGFASGYLDAGAPGLGETDRNGLPGGSGTVLPFAYVLDFLVHIFTGLGA
jgi:hypothetical protein